MDSWLILAKFVFIIYMIMRFSYDAWERSGMSVLFILIYISINMFYYVMENRAIKNASFVLAVAVSALYALYFDQLFIILLPLNIYEFIGLNGFSAYLNAIPAFFILFIDKAIITEYILSASMLYLIYVLAKTADAKVNSLKDQNDELRKSVYSLYSRLDRSAEHEKQVRYMARLEERNKIDDIGHTITGSIMQLEAAKLLIGGDKDMAAKMLQNVIDLLKKGHESIRLVLRDLKPSAEEVGISRIRLIIDELAAKTPMAISLSCSRDLERITYTHWSVISDNIREALTNAIKYSGALKASVSIDVFNKFIKVEIKDNGKGTQIIKKGLGLEGIEERTQNLGGKVIIDGSNGFSVIFLLPVEVK